MAIAIRKARFPSVTEGATTMPAAPLIFRTTETTTAGVGRCRLGSHASGHDDRPGPGACSASGRAGGPCGRPRWRARAGDGDPRHGLRSPGAEGPGRDGRARGCSPGGDGPCVADVACRAGPHADDRSREPRQPALGAGRGPACLARILHGQGRLRVHAGAGRPGWEAGSASSDRGGSRRDGVVARGAAPGGPQWAGRRRYGTPAHLFGRRPADGRCRPRRGGRVRGRLRCVVA